MSLKTQFKNAVVTAYNATTSVWISATIVDLDTAAYDPYHAYSGDRGERFTFDVLPTTNSTKSQRNEEGHRVTTHERVIIFNPDDLPIDYNIIDKVEIDGISFETEEITLINEDVLVRLVLRGNG